MGITFGGSTGRVGHAVVQGLLLLWIVTWLVVATIAAVQIRDLASYSDTLAQSGKALDTAGSALQLVGALPVVGDGAERLGDEVRATAAEVQVSAEETRSSVRALSLILGLSLACIPTVPVLAVYLPLRLARGRELRAVRAALVKSAGDPAFEEFLARRAVQHLPYEVLSAVTPTPWRDLDQGRYRALANAELTRLGIAETGGIDVARLRRRARPDA